MPRPGMLSFHLPETAEGAALDGIRAGLFDARGRRSPRRLLTHGAALVRGRAPARLENAGRTSPDPHGLDRRAPEAPTGRRRPPPAGRHLPVPGGAGPAG